MDNQIQTTKDNIMGLNFDDKIEEIEAAEAGEIETPEVAEVGETEVEPIAEPEGAAEEFNENTPAPVDANEYEPNFGYKVYDEELEIPENMRSFIKDKETEDLFRELYCKAGGLDKMKDKYSGLKDRVDNHYTTIENDYNTLNSNLDELSGMVQRDDYKGFFKSLGISDEKVMQYALKMAEYQEADPAIQAQVDAQYNQQAQSQELARQNQSYQEQIQQQAIQTRSILLDNELAKHADFVQMYDAKLGAGSFRDEVANQGLMAYQLRNEDVMPDVIIGQLMTKYSGFMPQAQQAPAAQIQTANQVVNAPAGQPVIPNVRGGQTSPAQKQPRSLADLQRLANSMD